MTIPNSTMAPESESAGSAVVRWEAAQGHLVYAAGRAELRISGVDALTTDDLSHLWSLVGLALRHTGDLPLPDPQANTTFSGIVLPAVTVSPLLRDDVVDPDGEGKPIGLRYRSGEAELFFAAEPDQNPLLYAFDTDDLPPEAVERDIADVLALLAHPHVRRAWARWSLGLPLQRCGG